MFCFIAVPLPAQIQLTLERLCYGLPHVTWNTKPDFYLSILPLGNVDGALILDAKSQLASLQFPPFSLILKGVGFTQSKNGRGCIWVGVEPLEPLHKLRKTLEHSLKEFLLLKGSSKDTPCIIIGRYEKADPRRLGEYLQMQADFETGPFPIDSIELFSSKSADEAASYSTSIQKYRLNG